MRSHVCLPRNVTRTGTTKHAGSIYTELVMSAGGPLAFGLAALLVTSWDFGLGDPQNGTIKSNPLFLYAYCTKSVFQHSNITDV